WEASCCELIRITNFTHRAITLPIGIVFAADYADIFEVRGLARARKGRLRPTKINEDGALLSYTGLDGVLRRTRLRCTPAPAEVTADELKFVITLPPRGTRELHIEIACEIDA